MRWLETLQSIGKRRLFFVLFFSHKENISTAKLSWVFINAQICLHKCLNFYFISPLLFIHCTFVWVWVLWLPVTMWIYFITRIQDEHLLVSDILESLIALSTFFVCLLPYVFLYFSAFWKKNPAEGRVLSCDIWTKKRLCGVFNLSCLIVTHFLWRCLYAHAFFFGRKVH